MIFPFFPCRTILFMLFSPMLNDDLIISHLLQRKIFSIWKEFVKWNMISSLRRARREGKKKGTPSLRYLATEILFKGYCIIFLMRFSSFSFFLVFPPFYINNLFSSCYGIALTLKRFLLNTLLKRRLAKLCRLLHSTFNILLSLSLLCSILVWSSRVGAAHIIFDSEQSITKH